MVANEDNAREGGADFSTLSRRRKTLAVNIPYRGTKEPSRLLIDSTALGTPATEAMG